MYVWKLVFKISCISSNNGIQGKGVGTARDLTKYTSSV